jgi:hypothetical protein
MNRRAGSPGEHYEGEDGQYALYVDGVRMLATPFVALLVDPHAGAVVTHGNPESVRAEWTALQELAICGTQADWLLLEGSPPVDLLNRALRDPAALQQLRAMVESPREWQTERLTRSLLERLRIAARTRGE